VIYSEKGGIDAETLRASLATRLAPFKLPAAIWFSAEPLPKLGTGKIDKRALRALYRDATAGAA
jgi:acyl-CoA synthetase (AMP-forming)/AMP-acid ligase II